MLTDEEKARIVFEEQYRNEVAQKFKSKSGIDLIETIIKILQGLAIIVGIWATYYAYKPCISNSLISGRTTFITSFCPWHDKKTK